MRRATRTRSKVDALTHRVIGAAYNVSNSLLKAADLPLCLLINFGRPRVEIRRVANDL